MKTFSEEFDWKQVFQDTDVNTKVDSFEAVVNSAVRHSLATKKRKRKPRCVTKRSIRCGRDIEKMKSTIYMRHTTGNGTKPEMRWYRIK